MTALAQHLTNGRREAREIVTPTASERRAALARAMACKATDEDWSVLQDSPPPRGVDGGEHA